MINFRRLTDANLAFGMGMEERGIFFSYSEKRDSLKRMEGFKKEMERRKEKEKVRKAAGK